MTIRPAEISEEDLSAFIDGELDARRAREVEHALLASPALAARAAALETDKRQLSGLYANVAQAAIPDSWRLRIEQATQPVSPPRRHLNLPTPRRRTAVALALAACLALLALATLLRPAPADPILAEADAARLDETPPVARLTGAALTDAPARDQILRGAVGLAVRAPDLSSQHFHLVELETYVHAATLRYRSDSGVSLTVYVRPSAGPPRFDLLRQGHIRTCIWQDEVVGAVMMGDMSAGQMGRVASAAYLALNL
jgi:anti-sigma factor RsiW